MKRSLDRFTVLRVAPLLLILLSAACAIPPSRALPATPSAEIVTTTAPAAPPTRTPTEAPTQQPTPSATPAPSATPSASAPLVVVDAGHGGTDLGARHFDAHGVMDYCESTVTLDLAMFVRDALLARGYRVLLTRDGDYMLNDFEEDTNGDGIIDTADDLQTRLDLINAEGADLLLSLHLNAFYFASGADSSGVGGTITYYCSDRPFGDDSLRFGLLVQEEVIAALRALGHDVDDRGVERDVALGAHLILLGPETERIARPSQMPGALSEPLFITHRREGELARDPEALSALAEAYAVAVERYFAGGTEP